MQATTRSWAVETIDLEQLLAEVRVVVARFLGLSALPANEEGPQMYAAVVESPILLPATVRVTRSTFVRLAELIDAPHAPILVLYRVRLTDAWSFWSFCTEPETGASSRAATDHIARLETAN